MNVRKLVAAFATVTLCATVAYAKFGSDIVAKIDKDPLWLKYYDMSPDAVSKRPSAHPDTHRVSGMKKGYYNWVYAITSKCNIDLHQCQYGWDLFLGKGTDPLKNWVRDVMEFAKWGDANTGGGDRYGKRFVSKISHDIHSIPRSAIGMAMYKQPGAADAIAKTLAKPVLIDDLYRKCTAGYGARGLWLQGADGKKHVDTLLAALKHNTNGCSRPQLSWMLPNLDTWTLSPEQLKGMEAFCSEKVWQENVGNVRPKLACLRYMGAIGTKNSDVHEFIRNYAEGNENSLRAEGIRTAGRLGLKSTKKFLKARLAKNYREKSKKVKKGKKYVQKKTDTWSTNFDAVSSAVALMGMGDKNAPKAIAYWLSYRTVGKSKRMAFMWNQGFKEVARDLAFAGPKAKKKVIAMASKAFKQGVKYADDTPDLHRDLFAIAIGLSHVGDKAALKYLMEILGASDKNLIKELLHAWGGEPQKMLELGRSTVGLGRFPVGKGGYSAKDAQKVIDTIKKRMKFWASGELKQDGIACALSIQAGIAAEKL